MNTEVTVQNGTLRGVVKQTVLSNKLYICFYGVPYAEPPLGELRFQPPVELKAWSGVLNATNIPSPCLQFGILENSIFGSEDCLYLNVYVPKFDDGNNLKPVMVFIHGGGFQNGSGNPNLHGPDFLIEQNVILVCVNYRLNVFGFLNMGLPECAGNMGLKDQRMALKWVKENIVKFGGDASNITVFGESAGAASVHYHILSPLSKGLLNKAILQSGCSLNSWAYTDIPTEHAVNLGKILGCQDPLDKGSLLQMLKTKSAEEIFEATRKLDVQNIKEKDVSLTFVPSLELVGEEKDKFLPAEPETLMKSAPAMPIMFGFNEQEGLVFTLFGGSLHHFYKIHENLRIVPKKFFRGPRQVIEIADEIKQFYFGDKPICEDTLEQLADFLSDFHFCKELYKTVEPIANKNQNVFIYNFCYTGELNWVKNMVTHLLPREIKGNIHADDIGYLFFCEQLFKDHEFSAEDKHMIGTMCKLWTNFAKNGDPSSLDIPVKWLPHTHQSPHYLRIDSDLKLVNKKLYEERVNFWEKLENTIFADSSSKL